MRTFLDSGVLLAAWGGTSAESKAAFEILESSRSFVTSQMVRLELLPKPSYHKQTLEQEFYNIYFSRVKQEEPLSETLGKEAFDLAVRYGLAAADGLNIAAAIRLKAEQFVTTELPGKPMFRVREIKVISLHQSQR